MIPLETRLKKLTWGQIISDLSERGFLNTSSKTHYAVENEFLTIKECASLTGYKEAYLRQLVFKRAIPFHKNPKLKPIRFKRAEIITWMATKKFTPIQEQADDYLSNPNKSKAHV